MFSLRYLFFAHHPPCQLDRTFEIPFGNRKIVLCARCTAQYTALILYLLVARRTLVFDYWVIALLPLGASIDWLTQALEWRLSNNILRSITGGLFGVWLGISIQALWLRQKELIIFLLIQSGFYLFGVLGTLALRPGSLNRYLEPYEMFVREYVQQKAKSG
ncbi:DUF2085 domain-containing protein [Desulfosporosinus acididurans]|nr:DUF2085 domain-containing protein [Desulfosporosinus acididurans]